MICANCGVDAEFDGSMCCNCGATIGVGMLPKKPSIEQFYPKFENQLSTNVESQEIIDHRNWIKENFGGQRKKVIYPKVFPANAQSDTSLDSYVASTIDIIQFGLDRLLRDMSFGRKMYIADAMSLSKAIEDAIVALNGVPIANTLVFWYGLDGNMPLSVYKIADKLGSSEDEVLQGYKKAMTSLRDPAVKHSILNILDNYHSNEQEETN